MVDHCLSRAELGMIISDVFGGGQSDADHQKGVVRRCKVAPSKVRRVVDHWQDRCKEVAEYFWQDRCKGMVYYWQDRCEVVVDYCWHGRCKGVVVCWQDRWAEQTLRQS